MLRRIFIACVLFALFLAGCGSSSAVLPETDAVDGPEAVVYKSPT